MKREKYPAREVLLVGDRQRETALTILMNAPLDPDKPLLFAIHEYAKPRKDEQNAAMWSGPLRDIEQQGYVEGRTYSADVWHVFFKRQFLPEEYDPELCLKGYRKWDYTPDGERVLVGSTKKLSVKGFAKYLTEVEAYAASELGVVFTASPRLAA